jgi:hypothetical protein
MKVEEIKNANISLHFMNKFHNVAYSPIARVVCNRVGVQVRGRTHRESCLLKTIFKMPKLILSYPSPNIKQLVRIKIN